MKKIKPNDRRTEDNQSFFDKHRDFFIKVVLTIIAGFILTVAMDIKANFATMALSYTHAVSDIKDNKSEIKCTKKEVRTNTGRIIKIESEIF